MCTFVVSNVNNMADSTNLSDDLANVLPEFGDVFEEIFHDDDSDGFEDYELDQREEIDQPYDACSEENWTRGRLSPSTFTFSPEPGARFEQTPATHLEYFQHLVTEDIISTIVTETNRYAADFLANHRNLPANSRLRKWSPVTNNEMTAFLGMIIAMGLVTQANIQDYWSTDPVIRTPFFGTVISRDRFLCIMSFLHLSDNSMALQRGQENYSPLQKLGRPYLEVVENFARVYTPHQQLAIDEGMIPWRGNLHFRVYSPDKPTKYGIKLFMLCDSTNGYCSRLELFTGRESRPAASEYGVTYDLVMRLIQPYLNKGYKLFTDNYFTSPYLYYNLYLKSTLACGTLRCNRKGVPRMLKEARPERGNIVTFNNQVLTAVKFADKKDVYLLTTIHEGKMLPTGKRDREGNAVSKPDCVVDYNKYMGAVDRCDQMVTYGSFQRNTLKWWKKVFFHTLGLAVLNAYLLYKSREDHPVPHRVFRRQLVAQLVEDSRVTGPETAGRRRTAPENLQRLSARHFPCHLPPTGKKLHAQRQCVVCGPAEAEIFKTQNPGVRVPHRTGHHTTLQCSQCKVALCVTPCFELYHTVSDFVLAYRRRQQQTTARDIRQEE